MHACWDMDVGRCGAQGQPAPALPPSWTGGSPQWWLRGQALATLEVPSWKEALVRSTHSKSCAAHLVPIHLVSCLGHSIAGSRIPVRPLVTPHAPARPSTCSSLFPASALTQQRHRCLRSEALETGQLWKPNCGRACPQPKSCRCCASRALCSGFASMSRGCGWLRGCGQSARQSQLPKNS